MPGVSVSLSCAVSEGVVCITLASAHPTTVPSSSLTVLPHPISIVKSSAPGRLSGDMLARLIEVVPFEPTENARKRDSRELMMSSNRSTALAGVVDDAEVGVSPPQAAQSETMIGRRAANRMIQYSILTVDVAARPSAGRNHVSGVGSWDSGPGLGQVLVHQLRHFEHVHRCLAAEHRLERRVPVDHPPVRLVLQPVLLDVGPESLGDLGAWNRLGADDFRDGCVGLNRPHERRIRSAFLSTSLLRRFPRSLLGHVISSAQACLAEPRDALARAGEGG